ncbi:hypothetical protein [Kozakia baliensis]|nr:hypothetical protein [Kozakia baliensis]
MARGTYRHCELIASSIKKHENIVAPVWLLAHLRHLRGSDEILEKAKSNK